MPDLELSLECVCVQCGAPMSRADYPAITCDGECSAAYEVRSALTPYMSATDVRRRLDRLTRLEMGWMERAFDGVRHTLHPGSVTVLENAGYAHVIHGLAADLFLTALGEQLIMGKRRFNL